MNLVVGSTGLVGHEICLRLAAEGKPVRALVRHTSQPEKLASLRAAGVELAFRDLKDPASLATACRGVDAIVSTASSTLSRQPGDSIETVDLEGQLNLVSAAREANVPRFIFVSFRPSPEFPCPLAEAKRQVEEAISDLNYTVIRAGFFMEVWLSPALGFDFANHTVRIYGDGTHPTSWVSFADVAEICVRALHHPAAERKTLDFGGPTPLSPLDTVAIFERLTGKPFKREHIPEAALLEQYQCATDPLQKSFSALMLGCAHGDAMEMTQMQQDFGLSLTSVEIYAQRVLST